MSDYIVSLEDVGMADVEKVGGKNASLGEMITDLNDAGVRVPPGIACHTPDEVATAAAKLSGPSGEVRQPRTGHPGLAAPTEPHQSTSVTGERGTPHEAR